MPVVITPEMVIEECPQAANVPTSVLERYICIVDQADDCLDNCEKLNDCLIEQLKISAVCYLITANGLISNFKSNRSPTGESFTNFDNANETGLNSNAYGRQVRMLDKCGCLIDVLETPENERFIWVAGS